MKLSVIIPCRNEVNYIEECIDAIYSNEFTTEIDMTVVVVDGMSNDGTRQTIETLQTKYATLKLIDNIQQLTPYAFNLGIHFKEADFYQIVGARQILSSNYLQKAINILNSDKSIWCVGGAVENVYINYESEMIAKAMSTSFGMGLGNFRTLKKSDFTDTVGTPMYPKFVFEKIGFFDEDLVRNQDDDFNFRVTKEGGKIWFEASIELKYYVRGNFKGLFRQFFQYGYWKVCVNKKHRRITTIRQMVPAIFVLGLFAGIITVILFPHRWEYLALYLFIYFASASLYALKVAQSVSRFFAILFSFFILHVSYGMGYLEGIVNFILLNRKPSKGKSELTR